MLSAQENYQAPIRNWPLTSSILNGWYWKLCQLKSCSPFLAHFLWRCFHWPTWTWIVFNRFPTPLKLFGPKLYLVLGRWNITIYIILPFMDFFRLLRFLCEELYYGTKFQIPHVHCRPARHCTCHPPSASTYVELICECGCNMSGHVPTCTCKVTPGVAM